MASDANVDGKSRLKRTGTSTIILFTHIVCFEIKYSRETTLGRLMHQQNLRMKESTCNVSHRNQNWTCFEKVRKIDQKSNASKLIDTEVLAQHYNHPVNSINSVIVLLIIAKKQSNNYVKTYDEKSQRKLLNCIAKVVILLIFLPIISYDSIRFCYYFVASLLWATLNGMSWFD